MKQGIKAKDIRDFEKAVKRLGEVLERIRQYKPSAYIYVTPSQINLMSDKNDEVSANQELIVTSGIIVHLDCGDWQEVIYMCKYCEHENNDFVILNETTDYSGIEVTLNRQGVLRVRYYDDSQIWFSEDMINIKFCPICGRKIL